MKQRYKATISYNGSNYHGWAIQPNQITIQGEIEKAIKNVFDQKVKVFAAGRTDSGVNALGQVIHFDLSINITPKQIKDALNKALPYDIRINKVNKTNKNFNARFNAKNKIYIYSINTNKTNNAIESNHVYQYNKDINLKKLKFASKLFIGKHNFLSFSTDERDRESLVREIQSISFTKKKDLIQIKVKGTGFLRSQVRMIVGSFLALNEDKILTNDIKKNLKNPKKGASTYKAPACGLCLYKVYY